MSGMAQPTLSDRPAFRSLGPDEAKLALGLAAMHASAATLDMAERILGDRRKAWGTVRRLVSKGWLQRASRGHYAFLPPDWGAEKVEDFDVLLLAASSVDSGYVGWWAAASRHGFTTQVPHTIHVATERRMAPREIQGTPIRYVRLPSHKFFGWQDTMTSGRSFRMSSPEKTVVDCVEKPDLCGGLTELARIVGRAANGLTADTLVDTATMFGTVSVCQRLGYLLDAAAPGYLTDPARAKLRGFVPPTARSVLGRLKREERDVGYVADWGLLVNAEEADILSEVQEHGQGSRP